MIEPIDITESFREALRCDGRRGTDPELVCEGLGGMLARTADKVVGGLFSKNITKARRKMGSWTDSFKEAMGDIGHTIRRDIEKIAKFGANASKWSAVVSGDLTQHVTQGLTGKGGVPANFKLPAVKLPNGKKVNDIPVAWAICAQSSLFDMVNNLRDDLPSIVELLGTASNTINMAAYIAAVPRFGRAPYNDIVSYIASGAGGQLPRATTYDEAKDESFQEALNAFFQVGWRPTNMQSFSGTINIMCTQYYMNAFGFLADNGIAKFTDQWYEANKQLWGWSGDKEPVDEPGQDFDEYVRSKLVKANKAKQTGPKSNEQACAAIAEPLAELMSKKDTKPSAVVNAIHGVVPEYKSAKSKSAFGKLVGAAKGADEDAEKFDAFKAEMTAYLAAIGFNADNQNVLKAFNNDEDAFNSWKESVSNTLGSTEAWKMPGTEDKPEDGEKPEEGKSGEPSAEAGAASAEGGEKPEGDAKPAEAGKEAGTATDSDMDSDTGGVETSITTKGSSDVKPGASAAVATPAKGAEPKKSEIEPSAGETKRSTEPVDAKSEFKPAAGEPPKPDTGTTTGSTISAPAATPAAKTPVTQPKARTPKVSTRRGTTKPRRKAVKSASPQKPVAKSKPAKQPNPKAKKPKSDKLATTK